MLLDLPLQRGQIAATPMRISDRYIGRQVLFGTLLAIVVLSMVLLLGNLFKQIRPLLVDKHAPLWMVLRFVLTVLPFSLMFTIPWGFLSAVLLVFGRLSSDQEITSFRVAGESLARLVAPVFVLAGLLCGVCLWLHINVVPLARSSLTDLLYEQAKRELTGGVDQDPQEAISESVPESERWDTMPGSTGYKTPESPSEDEGRSEGEQIVEQGVAEAEHDQMLQAAKESAKQDKEGN